MPKRICNPNGLPLEAWYWVNKLTFVKGFEPGWTWNKGINFSDFTIHFRVWLRYLVSQCSFPYSPYKKEGSNAEDERRPFVCLEILNFSWFPPLLWITQISKWSQIRYCIRSLPRGGMYRVVQCTSPTKRFPVGSVSVVLSAEVVASLERICMSCFFKQTYFSNSRIQTKDTPLHGYTKNPQ